MGHAASMEETRNAEMNLDWKTRREDNTQEYLNIDGEDKTRMDLRGRLGSCRLESCGSGEGPVTNLVVNM
jgi:hypothetical protein